MFRLRNDDTRSTYAHRAQAIVAAAVRAWTQSAVTVDEYDDVGDYAGSCVLAIRLVQDPNAPPHWPPSGDDGRP